MYAAMDEAVRCRHSAGVFRRLFFPLTFSRRVVQAAVARAFALYPLSWLPMCGRVVQASDPLRYAFVDGLNLPDSRMKPPSYNAAPGQLIS
jgi:hypothetical protein